MECKDCFKSMQQNVGKSHDDELFFFFFNQRMFKLYHELFFLIRSQFSLYIHNVMKKVPVVYKLNFS